MDGTEEEVWYLRRLDAGLSALQLCDYVIAWACVEDDGVSTPLRAGTDIPRRKLTLKSYLHAEAKPCRMWSES